MVCKFCWVVLFWLLPIGFVGLMQWLYLCIMYVTWLLNYTLIVNRIKEFSLLLFSIIIGIRLSVEGYIYISHWYSLWWVMDWLLILDVFRICLWILGNYGIVNFGMSKLKETFTIFSGIREFLYMFSIHFVIYIYIYIYIY
jgi:hypothetical protein